MNVYQPDLFTDRIRCNITDWMCDQEEYNWDLTGSTAEKELTMALFSYEIYVNSKLMILPIVLSILRYDCVTFELWPNKQDSEWEAYKDNGYRKAYDKIPIRIDPHHPVDSLREPLNNTTFNIPDDMMEKMINHCGIVPESSSVPKRRPRTAGLNFRVLTCARASSSRARRNMGSRRDTKAMISARHCVRPTRYGPVSRSSGQRM